MARGEIAPRSEPVLTPDEFRRAYESLGEKDRGLDRGVRAHPRGQLSPRASKPLATAWGDRKPLAASFQGLVPKPGGAFAFEMRTSGVPTMLARIGVMTALNRDVERVFDPSRKDTHWGRRKLKRDE